MSVMNDTSNEPAALIDITDDVFKSVSQITDGKVVKSDLFNLLEGTRAVEINNKKLDTGLIPLSLEELKFDPRKPRTTDEVLSICDKLIRSFVAWINYSSLPITVLSSRHIQTLLENYGSSLDHVGTIDYCTFEYKRFRKQELYDEKSHDYLLVNKVLRAFVLGYLKFIGFCLYVAFNVLYEEEDLTTRSMELNFLSEVPVRIIVKEIDEAIQWVRTNVKGDDQRFLVNYLQFSSSVSQVESILSVSLPIFSNISTQVMQASHLKAAIETLEALKAVNANRAPVGAFSKFIQLDMSNKNIPAELHEVSHEEAYNELIKMFQCLHRFIGKTENLKNYVQLENYLKFGVAFKIGSDFNVIARGIFQLYFIRDDKSIIGSQETINTFVLRKIESLVGPNSVIMDPSQWNLQGSSASVQLQKNQILNRLNTSFRDLESGQYHYLSTFANNRCRQRQLLSKSLLIWDALQVNIETMELELWETYHIGEEIADSEPALVLSSYVYYMKLELMIETALLGFELEIYKEFEICLMYWYISHLTRLATDLLRYRIKRILESKINNITVTIPKRLKKLKAGPKKTNLKDAHKYLSEKALPSLKENLFYNENYLEPHFRSIQLLADGLKIFLVSLSSLDLITFYAPKKSIASPEMLYRLRMKPWSSIGVPSLPTFDEYKQSINLDFLEGQDKKEKILKLLLSAKDSFNQSKLVLNTLLSYIENSKNKFSGTNAGEWYNGLMKTAVLYSIEVTAVLKLLNSFETSQISQKSHRVMIRAGYNAYFPKIEVSTI